MSDLTGRVNDCNCTGSPDCTGLCKPAPVAVPEGYVLVPKSVYLDAASIESMAFVMGGPEEDDGSPTYCDCVMWVGEIDDDGVKRHGIHVFNTECEEEGSITLAEFAAAPQPPCDMGALCLDCQPREGGECPDAQQSEPAPAQDEREAGFEAWAKGKFSYGKFIGQLYGNTDWALARKVWSAAMDYASTRPAQTEPQSASNGDPDER